MNGNTYDVVIIGGGVIGSSIARALSKYECRTVLLEKEEDVCSGTSKAVSYTHLQSGTTKPANIWQTW